MSFLRWSPNAQPYFIPRGTVIHSTAPGWPNEGRPSKRGQSVYAVRDADGGLTWPGAGSYWKRCRLPESGETTTTREAPGER